MVSSTENRVVCCIIARTNSTRLPRKVLKEVSGRKMIEHIIDRMKLVPSLNNIYIATSSHDDDKVLCNVAYENGIKVYCGSELSVIDRMIDISDLEKADYVVRVTGDNIYTDPKLLELLIERAISECADYARVEGAPIGVTAEVIKVTALKKCLSFMSPELSEYLMLYMFNPDLFKTVVLDVSTWVPPLTSLTVDTSGDWLRTQFIENEIGKGKYINLSDIIDLSSREVVPEFHLDGTAVVKLPESKEISLECFMKRQSILAKKSHVHIQLSQEEYDNA